MMSLRTPLLGAGWSRVSVRGRAKARRTPSDLDALLTRFRQRLYPETLPVLASYWLKTVYAGHHARGWWRELREEISQAVRKNDLDGPVRDILAEIQACVRNRILPGGETPPPPPSRVQPFRDLTAERIPPYAARLLNRWLPAEVAHLLVDREAAGAQDGGIPVLAAAGVLERLLVRERFSPTTLEMFLQPGMFSPLDIYPADAEILRDVVLALLGRTSAAAPPVMPAAIAVVAAGSALPADYHEAVRKAFHSQVDGREELRVPIATADAFRILKSDTVRIGCILVSMDGRWWESDNLESGDPHVIVYRPKGRLRIDYSADHAKLKLPWPEVRLTWAGAVDFQKPLALFGREWHASRWETDSDRTWAHLVFSRTLDGTGTHTGPDEVYRRSRPAFIDMAWATLENALESSVICRNSEPIERLSRPDLIPLGRSIYGLADSVRSRRQPKREAIETQLRAIRYLEAEVSLRYGRVPWRVLPPPVRETLMHGRLDPDLLDLLNQVFAELPNEFALTRN
jgi:hypothetical protein